MTESIYHSLMLFRPPPLEAELDVIEMITAAQGELRWRVAEPRRWSGSLRRLTQARSIQGSNSIEGYDASLDDVIAAIEDEEPLDAPAETREALRGYRDAMTYVLQLSRQDEQPVVDETLLRSLHFMMLRYDMTKNPGTYRPGAIWIRRESDGKVVYEAPDIDAARLLMAELTASLAEPSEHPLIDAAMAHLNLVLIHPFSDGNGRMARALQTLVIARDKVLVPEFNSIEEHLGRNTQAYYDVLADVAGGSWQSERDTRPWIRFCLTAHFQQVQTALRRTQAAEQLWEEIDTLLAWPIAHPRAVGPLYDAANGLRIRNTTYRSSVRAAEGIDISEQTASRDLRALAESGLLAPRGERRGRTYTAGPRLQGLARRVREAHRGQIEDPFE
jgi:Fic family protein